jgi:hypothetical protein
MHKSQIKCWKIDRYGIYEFPHISKLFKLQYSKVGGSLTVWQDFFFFLNVIFTLPISDFFGGFCTGPSIVICAHETVSLVGVYVMKLSNYFKRDDFFG